MPEQVTTVTISGKVTDSNADNTSFNFSVLFKPPEPINGKVCYLKVKSFFINEDHDNEAVDLESTWLLNLDWSQPNSISYIYDEIDNTTTGRSYPRKGSPNQTVAMLTKLVNGHTCQVEHPRCLVEIPNGQHPLKVTVQRVTDAVTDYAGYTIWGITFNAEIIPVEAP
jgi:hypothetical protein